ncbi:MAG: outer membrane lipoprotein-sorting protein [Chthoniobacteraceae bacterium]
MALGVAVFVLFLAGNLAMASTVGDDPYEILAKVRQNQMGQHRVLDGQLQHGETVVPFRLTMDEGEITYQFFNPDEALVLHLNDKGSQLEEVTKKGTERVVTAAQYDKSIRGTDISYEDLAMRFLYWPVAKIAGEEIMVGRNCWKLRVEPGSGKNSQYGYVMLWIEKQSGALAQVETYDRSGNLAKRFKVTDVQRAEGGGYILKKMRIQRMVDGKPADPTPTYLEIKKPGEEN